MNSTNCGFFLVGGRSFLSRVGVVSPSSKNRMADLTPLGATAPVKQPTMLSDFTLSQSGWLDDAVGQAHEALIGAGGRTSQVIVLSLEGNTLGATMIGASGAFSASYDKGVTVGDFTRANVEYALSGRVDDMAVIVSPYQARTTAGNTESTPVDNGASSAAGGAAYLAVSDLTLGGYTNLVVKIRHAAVATFADLVTFTAVTAAPTALAPAAVAGTVNRNLAISWAWTGAGSGTSATFVVGFARN
jgi:hypothetical protein